MGSKKPTRPALVSPAFIAHLGLPEQLGGSLRSWLAEQAITSGSRLLSRNSRIEIEICEFAGSKQEDFDNALTQFVGECELTVQPRLEHVHLTLVNFPVQTLGFLG